MAESDVTLDELQAFLALVIEAGTRAADNLRFNFRKPAERFIVLLLLSMIDYARSARAMLIAGEFKGIAGAARSVLDAYADLRNLCTEDDYWENLELPDEVAWNKTCQIASAGKNETLRPFTESELLKPARRLYAKEVERLKDKGVTKLETEVRFRRAGLSDEYAGFAMLSAVVHNSPSYMTWLYFDVRADTPQRRPWGDDGPMVPNFGRSSALMLAEILLRSTERVLQRFGHGKAGVTGAFEELERIQAVWKRPITDS